MLHQEAVNRMRNMLHKYYEDTGFSEYLLLLQEVLSSEYTISSLPYLFIDIIGSIISFRLVRLGLHRFNLKVLENFGYNLNKMISSFINNIISLDSEFRDLILLAPLLSYHPYWKDFLHIMRKRVTNEFNNISEDQRILDLNVAIERGNHRLVSSKEEVLQELVMDNVCT